MALSDMTLLRRWADSRDAEAFNELVSRYSGMVYATCRRVLGNAADAEEVAQDCFLRIAEGGTPIRNSFGGWLHRLATSRSIDRLRADKRRREREERFAARPGQRETVEWDDVLRHVDEAIADLPESCREPIVRHFLGRETQESIAASLGISRPAVTQRIGKGVERIRTFLKRKGLPVSTSALGAMLAADMAEAAPVSLVEALGKVALAGVTGNTAATTMTSVAALGGAIMWKKAIVACGILALGLGLAYTVGKQRNASSPSLAPMRADGAAARPGPVVSQAASHHVASSGAKSPTSPNSDADGADKGSEQLDGRVEALVAELRERWAQERAGETDLAAVTSADIPVDNGAHYFLLAAELFPEVDRDWLCAKLEGIKANGWVEDPELRVLFAASRDSFDAIRMGLQVGNAMLPLARGFEEPLPYLSTYRTLARVMVMEAAMYAAEGDYAAAFDDCVTALSFGHESPRGGTIIHGLVGYAVDDIAARSLAEAIAQGGAGTDEYRWVVEQLQKADERPCTAWESMASEAESMTKWLEGQIEQGADLRPILTELMTIIEHDDTELQEKSNTELYALVQDMARVYRQSLDYLALPLYETEPSDAVTIAEDNALLRALFPDVEKLRANQAWSQALVRGTTIVAALELYRVENGAYPAQLSALAPSCITNVPADPFTGRSFAYTPGQTGYTLYSAGWDMQYDGAQVDSWKDPGGDVVLRKE